MDMEETTHGQREPSRIKFKLVESKMFASFDGEWRMQVFSRRKGPTAASSARRSSTTASPSALAGAGARAGGAAAARQRRSAPRRLPQRAAPPPTAPPPAARVADTKDVPMNMRAVKAAAEKLSASESAARRGWRACRRGAEYCE